MQRKNQIFGVTLKSWPKFIRKQALWKTCTIIWCPVGLERLEKLEKLKNIAFLEKKAGKAGEV